ncbi:AraC family transcriptional regulator [Streptomyces parvulus]|uniref:AraC family transcriptional regulator n=1 Tax=Streptomyces parvulus TaxID=146923 RepID=A0ABV5DJB2_9ACTN
MDPLEDVLTLLETRSRLSAGLVAGGRWAVRFDAPPVVKFNAVRKGSCQLVVDGVPEPFELAEGDCYLLTRPRSYILRSDPETDPVEGSTVFAGAVDGIARAGQGSDVFLLGGGFAFSNRAQDLLLGQLPPVLHVSAGTPHAETVRWALAAINQELTGRPMAGALVAEHLAVVMLVHMLRLHLEQSPRTASGWLSGLTDPVVAQALTALHGNPAHAWTVAELADAAAVSRSTLAARFKAAVGQGPLEYLAHWRIELAARRLRKDGATLASIARSVGYGSESALSVAFKRITGTTPGEYRRRPTRT